MVKEDIRVTFKELGVVACHANNKRKMKSPIFDKLRLETIPLFYEKRGYIFRSADDPKEYYSMEQLQELFKNHVKVYICNILGMKLYYMVFKTT